MLGVITFAAMGLFSGMLTGWSFFAFGERSQKFTSGAVSIALVGVETYAAIKVFLPEGQDASVLIFSLIVSNVLAFFLVIIVLALILKFDKKKSEKFNITLTDVIFNNSKVLEDFNNSRRAELEEKLKTELNVEKLERKQQELESKEQEFVTRTNAWQSELDEAKSILAERDELYDSKFSITIPQRYKHAIKPEFFELLPRHAIKIGVFYSKLRPLTESFLKKTITGNPDDIFESYLFGVAGYMRTCLFDQASGENEVRVHFRVLDKNSMTYKAKPGLIACDTAHPMTDLKVNDGLIAASLSSKRSLVYTANRKDAKSTGSENLWQDYLSYCFEKIQVEGIPKYTFGISVKHKAAHSGFLYFLSYIQIEQIIQQDMIKLHNYLSKAYEEKAA
ncbi:hypothetical protein OH710_20720 [Pseudomonas capsici]|uniref:hypothetical protein n=1 Tax=Pseudomonas capsici TaxID=2810614 RepID=UPI0021F149C4|nr:hypothetical protein [Pseudomonas capsici]MCV4275069.1 hypothetical protein [Pseudomonas capsici]